MEPKKGGRLRFDWRGGEHYEGQVVKVVRNRLFEFTFGGKGELVVVKLLKDKFCAICQLKQYWMKAGVRDRAYMHLGRKVGRTFFMANLKNGADLRNHDIRKSWKQGFVDG